jgi:NTE family protein
MKKGGPGPPFSFAVSQIALSSHTLTRYTARKPKEELVQDIRLALSGGGVRAMVFHLGLLKYMAERNMLEKVTAVSSVSGGSLVTGFILKECGMRWPDSPTFLGGVYPALKKKLCGKSLIWGMIKQLPKEPSLILYRANLLARCLEKEWGVTESLAALPQSPEFSFEGTTAENGKRFRFKRDTLGDWELGYADASSFSLSRALAVSAAIPGGIGPLKINALDMVWKKPRNPDDPSSLVEVPCPFGALHLYDGGVYDNLGLEPFFDAATAQPKQKDAYLVASDAGAPFTKGFSYWLLNPLRLKRVLDVVMDQTRSLRIRGFHAYLRSGEHKGAYVWMNSTLRDPAHEPLRLFAASFPTTLRQLKNSEFDKLSACGYAVARERLLEPAPMADLMHLRP